MSKRYHCIMGDPPTIIALKHQTATYYIRIGVELSL